MRQITRKTKQNKIKQNKEKQTKKGTTTKISLATHQVVSLSYLRGGDTADNKKNKTKQDSARGHAIGRTDIFSNHNRQKIDVDYDEIATAIIRGLSSSDWKLSKLLGGHVNDIRSFLDSLATVDGLRVVTITFGILFRSSFLQRICRKAGYIG